MPLGLSALTLAVTWLWLYSGDRFANGDVHRSSAFTATAVLLLVLGFGAVVALVVLTGGAWIVWLGIR